MNIAGIAAPPTANALPAVASGNQEGIGATAQVGTGQSLRPPTRIADAQIPNEVQGRGINFNAIVSRIRARGHIVVAVPDMPASRPGAWSHQNAITDVFLKALPAGLRNKVQVVRMPMITSKGELNTDTLKKLQGMADRGEVDMVFTGADTIHDPRLADVNAWSGLRRQSLAELNSDDLEQAFGHLPQNQAMQTVDQIAAKLPFFSAVGNADNGGKIQFLGMAPNVIRIGASRQGSTKADFNVGTIDGVKRDPTNKGSSAAHSSFAAPLAAADLATVLAKRAGL
jgi:hypothetical protein